jgi:hypothetical protein
MIGFEALQGARKGKESLMRITPYKMKKKGRGQDDLFPTVYFIGKYIWS